MTAGAGSPTVGVRHRYETPWPAYAVAWAPRVEPEFRLAVGSCRDNGTNHIQVVELNEERQRLECVASADVPLPATKLMWRPTEDPSTNSSKDCLASTSNMLNLWKLEDGQLRSAAKLFNTRSQSTQPPITSFDWSPAADHKIGVSSVDTTCTIWNVERQRVETQLIAHDKAVYDICFCQKGNYFATVGADGSLRLFDQRNLEQSTIVYEAPAPCTLLRLAWNRINANLIATVGLDTFGATLVDIRRPGAAVKELAHDEAYASHLAWAPKSRHHLLCGSDNGYAYIWDVRDGGGAQLVPQAPAAAKDQPIGHAGPLSSPASATRRHQPTVLAYNCDTEVYQVQWPSSQPDYIALGTSEKIDIVQV